MIQAGVLQAEGLAAKVEVEDFGDGIDEFGEGGGVGLDLGEVEGRLVQEGDDDGLGALKGGGVDPFGFFDLGVPFLKGFAQSTGAELGPEADEGIAADGAAEASRGRQPTAADNLGDRGVTGEPVEELGALFGGELIEIPAAFGALGDGGRSGSGSGVCH